jgi:uncharacterized protein YkwD
MLRNLASIRRAAVPGLALVAVGLFTGFAGAAVAAPGATAAGASVGASVGGTAGLGATSSIDTAAITAGSSAATYIARVVALTNAQRKMHGCRALTVNATLTRVAQAHSTDMAVHNYFSHNSRNGTTPAARMTAAGYRYRYAAENIAAGQPNADAVMIAWMNSPGHRANVLNCKLTQLGVGYAVNPASTYNTYWTQDFGTPR